MRISNRFLYSTVMNNIKTNLEELEKYHFQLTSGKKVKYPSDDPVATVDAMRQKTYIAEVDQFERNIEDGMSWLNHTDSVLGEVTNVLHRVKELAIQGASETYNQKDRDRIAVEINQLLEEMLHFANTNFDNRFIFAGTDTKTTPFIITRGEPQNLIGDPPGKDTPPNMERLGINRDNITKVSCVGDTNPIYREIEKGVKMKVNTVGSQVFSVTKHKIEMGDMTVTDPGVYLNHAKLYSGEIATSLNGRGMFMVNGHKIFYDANFDSLTSLKEKINAEKCGVTASIIEEDIDNGIFEFDQERIEMTDNTITDQTIALNDPALYSGTIAPGLDGKGIIKINGQEITYDATIHNLEHIRDRINASNCGVTASIRSVVVGGETVYRLVLERVRGERIYLEDEKGNLLEKLGFIPPRNGKVYRLVLETYAPSEIRLEDINGDLLEKLKFIDPERQAPNNLARNAKEEKVTIFEMLIRLRDNLYQGNVREISSDDMGNITACLHNVLKFRGEAGAKVNRLQFTSSKLRDYRLHAKEILSNAEDIDIAEAIMELRLQEVVNQAALASGARLIRPTLMDFL